MNRIDQDYTKLRRQAEAELAYAPPTKQVPPPAEKLLHELRVHQIELEMQNEHLRQSQLELEESRDRYVDFYDFGTVGYLALNRNGMIDEINLTGAAMLGVERGKLTHHRFVSYVATEDQDRWHLYFANLLSRDSTLTCELTLLLGDGSHFDVRLDCRRMNKSGGESDVHIVLTDITELNQLKVRLDEQNKELYSLRNTSVELENRILELEQEVNILAARVGQPPRYSGADQELQS